MVDTVGRGVQIFFRTPVLPTLHTVNYYMRNFFVVLTPEFRQNPSFSVKFVSVELINELIMQTPSIDYSLNIPSAPGYLYYKVIQNMLRTCEGKKNHVCYCSLSAKQMPYTDQITEIIQDMHTYSELPSYLNIILCTAL